MIKLIIFGVCICLLILLVTKQPVLVKSRFHGNWKGAFYGEEEGSFSILIGDDGIIRGSLFIPSGEKELTGKVHKSGEFQMVAGEKESSILFSGEIAEMTGNGTWKKENQETTGSWTVNKE